MNRLPLCFLIMTGLLGGTGCDTGGEEAEQPALMAIATGASLLPLKEGNRWTYRVTDEGVVGTKEVTVGPEETVGGNGASSAKKANKVVTKQDDGDQGFSWQARDGERVVRYREQTIKKGSTKATGDERWTPSRLQVDESAAHTVLGASWVEEYAETKLSKSGVESTSNERDQWTVEAVDEAVTVPAGTFRAIVLQKAGGASPKKYWYVRGIGKVKETGTQTEELASYTIAP